MFWYTPHTSHFLRACYFRVFFEDTKSAKIWSMQIIGVLQLYIPNLELQCLSCACQYNSFLFAGWMWEPLMPVSSALFKLFWLKSWPLCICCYFQFVSTFLQTVKSLMAEWLERASQWHEMCYHNLEIISLNPGGIELGVYSTSVLWRTWTKTIFQWKTFVLHISIKRCWVCIEKNYFKMYWKQPSLMVRHRFLHEKWGMAVISRTGTSRMIIFSRDFLSPEHGCAQHDATLFTPYCHGHSFILEVGMVCCLVLLMLG